MRRLISSFSRLFLLLIVGVPFDAGAQSFPTDIGTTVNGFQEDFEGSKLPPGWIVSGQEAFSVSGGFLQVTTVGGDPNHLLYNGATYDSSVQEILARVRIRDFGSGDPCRAGIAAAVDPGTSQGINFFFRNEPGPTDRHVEFLDDLRAWATEYLFNWQNNTWYWLRMRHEPSSNGDDVRAKIWLADGTQAEPPDWQLTYNYFPGRSARSGLAGIAATSSGGTAEFDVDYVLIKAAGLPSIVVAPKSLVQVPASIKVQPQSQTVNEGDIVSFNVSTSGNPAPGIQWYRGDSPIAGATTSELVLNGARLEDDNVGFYAVAQNLVSNITRSATSSVATLTVRADKIPPRLIGAQSLGLGQVQVTFSEAVSLATATSLLNYSVTNASGNITISGANFGNSSSNVVLTLGPLQEGTRYTLNVHNITDRSSAANIISSDSNLDFTAVSFTPAAVGNPQPTGAIVPVAGGYQVSAGGNAIGGSSDQFQFGYQPRSGDFDVKIRVESLSLADPWAEAGLIARENESAEGRFAAVLATPSISGAFFKARTTIGQNASINGSLPVNYPDTWLRLQRKGNNFTGFASFDGQNWVRLGSATLTMPSNLLLGFGAASHNSAQTTTAVFRDYMSVSQEETVVARPKMEPIGQSSRMTSIVFSEIMYHPIERADGKNLEFIELLNTLGTPENISGYTLSGDVDYTFPNGTIIPGGGFVVVARNPADLQSVYGLTGVLGPLPNGLPNDGGTIRLRNRQGAILLEVPYGSRSPWPVAADGAGPSLTLARPSLGEDNPNAWAASDRIGGTPGAINTIQFTPLRNVVINEILAHTDDPELDYVELYNHSNTPLDLSGCVLTDHPLTNKFVLRQGTIIPAGGFLSFDQNALSFALSSDGETIYLKSPSGQILDAVRFGAQENGVSFGRQPDGATDFYRLSSKTPGASNSAVLRSDVVINEIMYHPISENDDDQYIELYNSGTSSVNLSGWRLEEGIRFTFPDDTILAAGGYLTVAKNVAHLQTNYTHLNAQNSLGDFSGALSHGGEQITLTKPDTIFSTNASGQVTSQLIHIVIDQVNYCDGGQWALWSDGGGSSLEKIDPRSDGRRAASWADSDETKKAGWTSVSVTGRLDNGTVSADQLQVLLQGAGEALIDDVQVLNASGANLIANGTFESSASGWTAEGTESPSGWESSEGANSARSYHVRAVDRGDNQVNRIRTPLTSALAANSTATIQAKVRWLKGHPEMLFRLRGNWLEAVATMNLPGNLGTPSALNSRALQNIGPVIFDVVHSPVLPAAAEAVVVTARIADPDGITNASLRYRIDPSSTYSTVPLRDDGTGGDAVAGDGVFRATIPGQNTGTLVAFYVTAGDSGSAASTFPSAPNRECLVRFGESTPTGNFPVYRVWMTQAIYNEWTTRHKLNNTPLPVTFVLGSDRVIYNAQALYAGSPYIAPGYSSPTSGRCGYTLSFPSDDRFLGDTDLVLDWPGGHGGERTALQEQMAYWLAEQMELPYSHRYTIRLHVNGVTDMERGTVFEAVNQPAGDFIEAWNPNDNDGDFYKIDRAFEFSDGGGLTADPQPRLQNYTTTGGAKKTARYRWTWMKRAADRANDYTNIFQLVDALNASSPEPYTSATGALIDLDEWMGILALEHIIVNFDAYGHEIGKNMYAYKPVDGKWQLYMFDLDWLMLAAAGRSSLYSASNASLYICEDPTMTRMYNHPPFRRAYLQAVKKAVDGPMVDTVCNPVMDAKYRSLVANGITYCDGQPLTDPGVVKTWFAQRRAFLLTQLNEGSASFSITSNGGNDFNTDQNTVTLTGTGSLGVKGLRVNGVDQPANWPTLTSWSITAPLRHGQNVLKIDAYDSAGTILSSDQITITTSSGAVLKDILVNEWMAANNSSLPDPADGDFDDWLELYNPNTVAVDLSNWSLSDTLNDAAARWPIPAGTSIPANGYLLVWADEELTQNSATNLDLHAGFKLSQNGETIALFDPAGRLIDSVVFDSQTNDISQGRLPNGSSTFAFFTKPTPRAVNRIEAVRFTNAQIGATGTVTLTWAAEPGATYRLQYTDDLSSPNWTNQQTVNASAATASTDVSTTLAPQRFYRVQQVEP